MTNIASDVQVSYPFIWFRDMLCKNAPTSSIDAVYRLKACMVLGTLVDFELHLDMIFLFIYVERKSLKIVIKHVFICSNPYIYTTVVQEVYTRDRSP